MTFHQVLTTWRELLLIERFLAALRGLVVELERRRDAVADVLGKEDQARLEEVYACLVHETSAADRASDQELDTSLPEHVH